MPEPRGATLLELVLVIALLAITSVIVAPPLRPAATEATSLATIADSLRRIAAREGRMHRAVVQSPTGPHWVAAWPSGLVVLDTPRVADDSSVGRPGARQ